MLTWKAAYERKEKKPIEVEGEARLTVEQVYGCAARQTPVVVDGKLDEWKELPLVCRQPAQILVAPESWVGPEDCFFRFGVEYDQEYLYIAVEVVDEQPVLFPEKLPWKQDGIEVLVDARPDPVRSNSRGQGLFENFLFIGLSPGATPGEMVFYKREQVGGEGVQAICAKTDGGHNTEIAIPLSYLDEKQGHRWEEFRLNIGVDDFDDPAGKLAQIWWQPNWRRSQDRPGSGTFKRR